MNDWNNINDKKPLPGQPITAEIFSDHSAGLIDVDGIRSDSEDTVVLFDFYSGTGAEVIVNWKPRILPMKENAHPWLGLANSGGRKVPERRREISETPESITKWAEATFGPTHPGAIARRMYHEVNELLQAFDETQDAPTAELGARTLAHIREEIADISIMLDQVGYLMGGDIQAVKDGKMRINRERRWAYSEARKQMRHVSRFKHLATGLSIHVDQWYLMSAARRRCLFPAGHESASDALAQANAVLPKGPWGLPSVKIQRLNPANNTWEPSGGYTFAVVLGRDLYDEQIKDKQ